MNCVNHPEAAVSAFCQNCGRGLCTQCSREVQGNVFCEPCLAARVTGATGAPGAPGAYQPGYAPPPMGAPNPGTATILGFIPGVGAMYNGQYIKAIVHVLVFVVLISITEHYGMFGIFVGAWVLYQVFDAHQTAKARRDGLPLPDPFGLNELGNAFGGHTAPRPYTPPVGTPPPAGTAAGAGPAPGQPYADWAEQARRQAHQYGQQGADWAEQVRQQAHQYGQQGAEWGEQLRQRIVAETTQAARPFTPGGPGTWGTPPQPGAGFAPGAVPPPPGWTAPPGAVPPFPPVPPQMELERARREPIGAIVLILLGMLFLFNTLGFFNFGWVSHGWPLIIVGIAVWLLARNSGRFRYVAPVGPQPPVGTQQANPPQPVGTSHEPPAGGGQ
jgi:hypothetical protein